MEIVRALLYLAAALNPTEIMKTHPEIVMLQYKMQKNMSVF